MYYIIKKDAAAISHVSSTFKKVLQRPKNQTKGTDDENEEKDLCKMHNKRESYSANTATPRSRI